MKITPYTTNPCDTLRAIGDELGLKTETYMLNGIIVEKLADFFDGTESNCIWRITTSLPMAVTIKTGVLNTRILIGPFNKPFNSYADTKQDIDASSMFQLKECNRSYELADPYFIDEFKKYIKHLKFTYYSL